MATKPRRRTAGARGGPTTEGEFLSSYRAAGFPRPSVTADVALVSAIAGGLYTLTVSRAEHPFKGFRALPGGFVHLDESLDEAAARVLWQKAKLRDVFLEQLFTFGHPRRDPRTRVISVAYYALLDSARFDEAAKASSEVEVARIVVPWEGETGGPVELADKSGAPIRLAFDHDEILGMAVKRLRGKLDYAPIGFQLLPERFTLFDLQKVHETILGRPLNKDSFRRRMLSSGLLESTGEIETEVDHRPAELYRFSKRSAV